MTVGTSEPECTNADSGMSVFGPWNGLDRHLELVLLERYLGQKTLARLQLLRMGVGKLTLRVWSRKVDIRGDGLIL